MIKLHLTPYGVVKEDDGNLEIYKFGDTPDKAGVNLYRLYKGRLSLENIVEDIKDSKQVFVTSRVLYKLLGRYSDLFDKIEYVDREKTSSELLVKTGVAKDAKEALKLIKDVMKAYSEEKLKEELANKDLLIIHAINSYDEYTETINLFYERLREWYGIYFPELAELVTKIESYANLVATLTWREEFTKENLLKLGYAEKKATAIEEAAKASRGGMLEMNDIEMIRIHAKMLKDMVKTRDAIENYLEELLEEVAPNITAIVGPKLAARLIAKAGGIKKLAMFPASTIQLLGAERALFLALRKGRKPPKHGIIFQHPFVSQSPKVIRGRVARILAGKLTIAARVDAFGGEYVGEKLYEEVKEKVEVLRQQAPKLKEKKIRVKPKPKKGAPRKRKKRRRRR